MQEDRGDREDVKKAGQPKSTTSLSCELSEKHWNGGVSAVRP
jgi:hypothetical protein